MHYWLFSLTVDILCKEVQEYNNWLCVGADREEMNHPFYLWYNLSQIFHLLEAHSNEWFSSFFQKDRAKMNRETRLSRLNSETFKRTDSCLSSSSSGTFGRRDSRLSSSSSEVFRSTDSRSSCSSIASSQRRCPCQVGAQIGNFKVIVGNCFSKPLLRRLWKNS